MERRLAFAALIAAALAACGPATTPGNPSGDPEGGVDVEWSIESTTLRPREGDLAQLVFRVTNRTKRPVILRTLRYLSRRAEESAPAATWQFSRAGELLYDAGRNEWTYERRTAGRRPPVFNSGLLVPTESVVVRTSVRLLHLPKTYHLLTIPLSPEDLRQKVYWEVRRDRDVRYTTLFGDDLRDRLHPNRAKDQAGHRIVVFPHADIVDTAKGGADIRVVRVNADLEARSFSLRDAIAKSGGARIDDYSFSEALNGWILRRKGGDELVTRTGVRKLPRFRRLEQAFFYVDSVGVGKVEIEFLKETKTLFAEKHRLVADPRQGRFFLFMQALDLLPFLEDVRDTGLEMDVQFTPQGGGRLLVTR